MAKKVKAKPIGHTDATKLSQDDLVKLRRRAARKSGVPVEALVGPFSGSDLPEAVNAKAGAQVPPGMYVAISLRTGQAVWRWRGSNYWARYSTRLARAHQLKTTSSRKGGMLWFGCDPTKVPADAKPYERAR